ncbi:reverse transcriptase domain-containing protein [Tanacetum coccineum]
MVPATTHLIGFSRETIWPLGQIALLVKIGDEVHSTSAWMNFMVIRSPSQHNAIIGRPGIRKLRAVPSTAHGMLKFPVEGGTVTLQSSRVIPKECAMISEPSIQTPAANQVLEEKINIAIHPEYPEQTVAIGSTLTEKGRKGLCSLLKQNLDIFAWKPADMTGVPRNIAEHRLNIREGYSPVRQKKRGQPSKNSMTNLECGVDFKDLNNACPKDCYPLPEIDWKVESLCGYSFKCFLDAYKGYHQIKMAKEDEEKTAFITSQGIFCYSKMPFGLKNAGSTYQRLVDKAFKSRLGRQLRGPWLRAIGPLQQNNVLREIHGSGFVQAAFGPRSVVSKVIQTGYYWPTMHKDARNLIRECNDCQIHRPVLRNPQQNLTPITSPWLFYKWGIDIAGPFSEGPGKVKFLIVAIDYFTKWIEAKAVATITGNQVKKFVWDNIVCRFGLPGEIISDNGKQFRDNPFKDWCEKLCIRQCFASVKHPQANGLVERANRSLGEGIKARLDEKSKDWIEELPHVLWAHRTMIKSSNGETPFSLTYDTEAVIPTEIGMPTLRTAEIDLTKNNKALGINLDLIKERREQAAIQKAKSKKKMEKYYNSRVRDASFKPGDMVYRSNEASQIQGNECKLDTK